MPAARTVYRTVLVLTFAVVANVAQATVITTTRQFGVDQSGNGGNQRTVRFPKFDGALGTLNSIRFILDSTYASDHDVTASAENVPPGGTLEVTGSHRAELSATIRPLGAPPQFALPFSIPGDLGCSATNTGSENSFLECQGGAFTGGDFDGDFVVDPGHHDLFIMNDPRREFDVSFTAFLNASCATNVGSCRLMSSSVAWGTLSFISTRGEMTVEYRFNEPTNGVPEPAALSLLAVGLMGLRFARRRRRRT